MQTTSKPPATLTGTIALKLTDGAIIGTFGAAITLYVTAFPYWERDAAITWLTLVLAFVVTPVALWWKTRDLDENGVRRMVLTYVGIPLTIVCVYGVLAAFGIAPAAPWSALG